MRRSPDRTALHSHGPAVPLPQPVPLSRDGSCNAAAGLDIPPRYGWTRSWLRYGPTAPVALPAGAYRQQDKHIFKGWNVPKIGECLIDRNIPGDPLQQPHIGVVIPPVVIDRGQEGLVPTAQATGFQVLQQNKAERPHRRGGPVLVVREIGLHLVYQPVKVHLLFQPAGKGILRNQHFKSKAQRNHPHCPHSTMAAPFCISQFSYRERYFVKGGISCRHPKKSPGGQKRKRAPEKPPPGHSPLSPQSRRPSS